MRKRQSQFVIKKRLGSAANPVLQQLENRRLFAIINVDNYGAIPNDGLDDMDGIQHALNVSSPGDTILFPGGVYNLKDFADQRHDSDGNGFVLPGDRKYLGQNGATLKGSDSKGPLIYPQSYVGNTKVPTNNVTISHLTFDGGGIYIDNVSNYNQNIVIDYNVFDMNMSGENCNGITANSGLMQSRITNNYFTGYNCSFAIYGYNYNTLTIANNELVNVNAGMHIDAFGNSGNLLVEQNYIVGAKGMGMEFQGAASNLVFQDNWYEHPNLSSVKERNDGTMAYSLILDKSSNITIRRNVVITDPETERPDGIGVRIGFEVGGDNTLVEDNYIDGINHALAMNDGDGTASVLAQNNRFKEYLEAPSSPHEHTTSPIRHLELINSGPDTVLSATMEARLASNQKPGIGIKRYGDPLPDTDGDPPADAPASPTNLDSKITGVIQVTLTWFDNSNNEDGFAVQMLQSDGITWQFVIAVGQNVTTCVVSNVADQTHLRLVAYNLAGNSSPSNSITVIALPAGPTNLSGAAVGTNRIDLHWTDNSSNESDFQIQLLAPDGHSWLTIGSVAADVTNFTINGMAAGQSYSFRVVAHNPNGYSPISDPTTVRTPMPDVVSGVAPARRTRVALIYQGASSTAIAPPMSTGS